MCEVLSGDGSAQSNRPAFPLRVLYSFQPEDIRLPDINQARNENCQPPFPVRRGSPSESRWYLKMRCVPSAHIASPTPFVQRTNVTFSEPIPTSQTTWPLLLIRRVTSQVIAVIAVIAVIEPLLSEAQQVEDLASAGAAINVVEAATTAAVAIEEKSFMSR